MPALDGVGGLWRSRFPEPLHFVIAYVLWHAIEGSACEPFSPLKHLLQVAQWHGFGSSDPIEIHVVSQCVARSLVS